MWILDKFIQIVSDVTGIASKDIVSRSRQEDIVLARKVFVNICLKYGISTTALAATLNRTKEGIRKLYISSLADEETRGIYRTYYQQICNKLADLDFNKKD